MRLPEKIKKETGLPVYYGRMAKNTAKFPFIVYLGTGQNVEYADNSRYHVRNAYRIEYYYVKKDEDKEAALEAALSNLGFMFERSEDTYIDGSDIYVIYYYIS